MKKTIATISSFMLFTPLITSAHPGHGETDGFTITHYMVEPVHLIVFLTALAGSLLLIRSVRRNRQQK